MCILYCMYIICIYSIVCTLYNLLDPEPGGEKEELKPVLKNGLEPGRTKIRVQKYEDFFKILYIEICQMYEIFI